MGAAGAKLDEIAANERKIAELQAQVAQKLSVLEVEKRTEKQLAQLEKRAAELAKSAQQQKRQNQELERRISDAEAATKAAERECAQVKDTTRAALAEAREFQDE